jgi:hypothetical protein
MFAHLHPPNAFWMERCHFITESGSLLIWINGPFGSLPIRSWMSLPEEPQPGNERPLPKPWRLEEARRIIEEYSADLREIIKKLRRRLN